MPVKINNCKINFRCSQSWDSLIGTDRPDIKYCSECDRGVHYCTDEAELAAAQKNDWCVALDVEIKDRQIMPLLGDIKLQVSDFDVSDLIERVFESKDRSKKD